MKVTCFTHNWERIYKRDKRVEPEHLAALIILWGQEEHQKKCRRNKLNRWKKEYDHHTGTTSFAQIEDQFCRTTNAPFIPLPELHRRTMVQFKKGYDEDETRKQKLELAKKMQEALENTYSEVVTQSQEPLTREQNYNVSHLVCGLPKKGRTRWMGVGAQRVSTQFQPPPIFTPSTMPSGPSYMPQEDCTQQAMQLVSSVMSMLDGQISEEMWENIQEELMRVIQPTATFAMVSRQIMKSCRRRVPTRVQSQIMNFLATQKAFTGSGESSRQIGDDTIGSTSRRDGSASGNADDDMDRADDLS